MHIDKYIVQQFWSQLLSALHREAKICIFSWRRVGVHLWSHHSLLGLGYTWGNELLFEVRALQGQEDRALLLGF